jgi:SH3 domain-containing YSC84-like protein 1
MEDGMIGGRWRFAWLAVVAVVAVGCARFQLGDGDPQQQLVEDAAATVRAARTDPSFGNAPELLDRARAVLVVPQLIKGGFFVGGEGGRGVMSARTGGTWSDPAFYTLASGSFGLQVGVEAAQVVMIVLTDRAFQALQEDSFKFGGGIDLAVATIGTGVEGAVTPAMQPDIVVWSKAGGLYAGLTLEGSVIAPDEDANEDYYGGPVTARALLARPGGAGPLQAALPAP